MRIFYTLLTFMMLVTAPALAAVTITQPITFGEFVLRNNTAVRQMTINAKNQLTQDAAFITLVAPQRGSVNVSGFPTKTNLIINVTFNTLSSGSGDVFTVNNAVTFPTSVKTDNFGNASFFVGATLNTSGGGGFYPNATYNGLMTVSVNY